MKSIVPRCPPLRGRSRVLPPPHARSTRSAYTATKKNLRQSVRFTATPTLHRIYSSSPRLVFICGEEDASPQLAFSAASPFIHRKTSLFTATPILHRKSGFLVATLLVHRISGGSPQVERFAAR
jgi:hypothetical protein